MKKTMIFKKGACLLLAAFAVACSQEQEPTQQQGIRSAQSATVSLSGSIATEEGRAISLKKGTRGTWSPAFDWLPELGEMGVHAFIWTDDVADNFPIYTNSAGMGQGNTQDYRSKIDEVKYEGGEISLQWSDADLDNRLKDNRVTPGRSYNTRVVIGGVAGANTNEILFTKDAGTAPNPDKLVLINPNATDVPRQKRHIPLVSGQQLLDVSTDGSRLSKSGLSFSPKGMLLAIKPVLSERAKVSIAQVNGSLVYPRYILKAVNIINNFGLYWEAAYDKAQDRLQGVNGNSNSLRIELYSNEAMTEHPVLDAANPSDEVGYFYVWAHSENDPAFSFGSFHLEFELEELPILNGDDNSVYYPLSPTKSTTIKPAQSFFLGLSDGFVHRFNAPVYSEYFAVD